MEPQQFINNFENLFQIFVDDIYILLKGTNSQSVRSYSLNKNNKNIQITLETQINKKINILDNRTYLNLMFIENKYKLRPNDSKHPLSQKVSYFNYSYYIDLLVFH